MNTNYLLSPYAFDIQFPSLQNVILALRQSIPMDLSDVKEIPTGLAETIDGTLSDALRDCLSLILSGFECGDRIVFPINEDTFLVGSIEDDYLFEASSRFQHQRLVFWTSTVVLDENRDWDERLEEFRHSVAHMISDREIYFAEITPETFSSLERHAVPGIGEPAIRRSILRAIENRCMGRTSQDDFFIYPAIGDNDLGADGPLDMPEDEHGKIDFRIDDSPFDSSDVVPDLDTDSLYDELFDESGDDDFVDAADCSDSIVSAHITFGSRVRNIFRRKAAPEPMPSSFPEKPDSQDSAEDKKAHFATFAPNQTYPGDWTTIQVYLFPIESWGNVQTLAHEIDPDAKTKGFKPLSLGLQMNDRITCELECFDQGVKMPYATEDMVWKGEMLTTSFVLMVTERCRKSSIALRVMVSVNGAPAGQMMFTMRVADAPYDSFGPSGLLQYAHIESKGFKKVFISHSHKDRAAAELLAEVYRLHGLAYFLDVHSLEAGEVFDESILEHIDESDLFLLLWSENAANSDYVRKEYRHAMTRAYPQLNKDDARIAIKPLVISPPADPPADMKKIYNFKRIHG